MKDFSDYEIEQRWSRAHALMKQQGFDALFFTSEPEIRYFTGFRTEFWQSPTRPWFLILPQDQAPIAVIPEIGRALMEQTCITQIHSWASPHPEDDGIRLLCQFLKPYSKIGMPMGQESVLRMPLKDFYEVTQGISGKIADCTPLIQALRVIKSSAELAIMAKIANITSQAFDQAPDLFSVSQSLQQVFRKFRITLLEQGADNVPYLAGAAGQGGYGDIISPPSEQEIKAGDILMLDTGATLQGYYADFDRNYAFGHADDRAKYGYQTLWHAIEEGINAAKAGVSCADLFHLMNRSIGNEQESVGRYGHGLGIQLTEYPSIAAYDQTKLQPNMVLTIEPSIMLAEDKMLVLEENIIITEDQPILLSKRAPPELPILT